MLQRLRQTGALAEITVVAAVPMHRKDQYERGYNQSELLAKQIARQAGLPYRRLLNKDRVTPKQHDLSGRERRENLTNAFSPAREAVSFLREGEHTVLLCDDVLTTGATLNECAGVLKRAGAASVICCTVAIAPRRAKLEYAEREYAEREQNRQENAPESMD